MSWDCWISWSLSDLEGKRVIIVFSLSKKHTGILFCVSEISYKNTDTYITSKKRREDKSVQVLLLCSHLGILKFWLVLMEIHKAFTPVVSSAGKATSPYLLLHLLWPKWIIPLFLDSFPNKCFPIPKEPAVFPLVQLAFWKSWSWSARSSHFWTLGVCEVLRVTGLPNSFEMHSLPRKGLHCWPNVLGTFFSIQIN